MMIGHYDLAGGNADVATTGVFAQHDGMAILHGI